MGEVVMGDNTATGGGVVLAQRVEQLANPGSLCITAALHEALPKRMPFELGNIGEQTLKGFSEPVRAYAVTLKSGSAIPPPEQHSTRTTPRNKRPRNRSIAVGALSLIVILGGGLAWLKPWKPGEPLSCVESLALELPDRPTLAVLPFENLTGDAEQEYFSDGITVRLITALANIPDLCVIARDSALASSSVGSTTD